MFNIYIFDLRRLGIAEVPPNFAFSGQNYCISMNSAKKYRHIFHATVFFPLKA